MIVNWKNKGLKTIPLMNDSNKIENTLIFQPGWNDIKKEDWEKAKKHEMIAKQLKDGLFEEIGKISKKTVKKKIEKDGKVETIDDVVLNVKDTEFKELEQEQAIKVINKTFNLKTLKKWKKKEDKEEIRTLLLNRIEYVEKGGK